MEVFLACFFFALTIVLLYKRLEEVINNRNGNKKNRFRPYGFTSGRKNVGVKIHKGKKLVRKRAGSKYFRPSEVKH